jgi:hypothetical protein
MKGLLLIRTSSSGFEMCTSDASIRRTWLKTLPGPLQDSYMTEENNHPAAPPVERVGANKRAKAAASSPAATRKVKTKPEVLTEDARYELARKEAEARVVRHDLRDRLRGRP